MSRVILFHYTHKVVFFVRSEKQRFYAHLSLNFHFVRMDFQCGLTGIGRNDWLPKKLLSSVFENIHSFIQCINISNLFFLSSNKWMI